MYLMCNLLTVPAVRHHTSHFSSVAFILLEISTVKPCAKVRKQQPRRMTLPTKSKQLLYSRFGPLGSTKDLIHRQRTCRLSIFSSSQHCSSASAPCLGMFTLCRQARNVEELVTKGHYSLGSHLSSSIVSHGRCKVGGREESRKESGEIVIKLGERKSLQVLEVSCAVAHMLSLKANKAPVDDALPSLSSSASF